MKIVSQIQSVKVNLLNGLKINAPAKLLGGLALGAILITSVALSSGTTPASPLSANPVPEAVRSSSDLGGGITDFEEPYVNAVRSSSDLGGGITDFEEPYLNAVRSSSDLGGGITDFEEPYTSKVSSLPTQLVDIEDEGGTGRMFEPWEFSNWAGENEQANLFPEVDL